MFRAVMFGEISLLLACAAAAMSAAAMGTGDRRSYIVHMDESAMPTPFVEHEGWYRSVMSSLAAATGEASPEHLYTYRHVMRGFSAVLTARQLAELERTEGHVAAFPETFAQLHTTRTPEFLGLSAGDAGVWPASRYGEDVIIGVVDTGVWPESESFGDAGIRTPVPARWKGACEVGPGFHASMCNRKLIGARSFSKGLKQHGFNISSGDYDSPRDWLGHGSHTASTAAGAAVRGASFFGYANGTVTGVAPMARVAMYKAYFQDDTIMSAASDVLAAMDQAIADGVDVMSLSLSLPNTSYDTDVIAMGALAATHKGIFVTCAAGNDGSDGYTIVNGAPWITTVGASTIDRDFAAIVTLGNGSSIKGKSTYPATAPIVGADLYYGHGNRSTERCETSSLSGDDVRGKFVFCNAGEDIWEQVDELQRTGARGAIISTNDAIDPIVNISLVRVTPDDGVAIENYYLTTAGNGGAPTVSIEFTGTVVGVKPAPSVVGFSSRGPYQLSPTILKPDVIAPGVDILAAWVQNKEIMDIDGQKLFSNYKLVSGTSMATPHVAGVAALLRSVHPDWSPAAIRSAMMTTAYVKDNADNVIISLPSGLPGTPLDFGSGHVSPNQAMDPGLVYDVAADEYVSFLCGLGYNSRQIAVITGGRSRGCPEANLDLNYPSFMVILNNQTNSATQTFRRVLTNVANTPANYSVSVMAPERMKVTVMPPELSFGGNGSKQEFVVTVQVSQVKRGSDAFNYIGNYGFLIWNEVGGNHVVRSPIVSAFAQ
ncbi:hypothetical protein ACP4OV_020349 [Aristida adscensionis]